MRIITLPSAEFQQLLDIYPNHSDDQGKGSPGYDVIQGAAYFPHDAEIVRWRPKADHIVVDLRVPMRRGHKTLMPYRLDSKA